MYRTAVLRGEDDETRTGPVPADQGRTRAGEGLPPVEPVRKPVSPLAGATARRNMENRFYCLPAIFLI